MISHAFLDRPWQVIATDLFKWNNRDYIPIAKYCGRYFGWEKKSPASQSTQSSIKVMLARYGILQRLISNDGPWYSSRGFKDITHAGTFITSHAGQFTYKAFRFRLAKKKRKHKHSMTDPYLGLLVYRNTEIRGLKYPEKLLSRHLHSILPTTENQLEPKLVCCNTVQK